MKRPLPRPYKSIGAWIPILEYMGYISTLVNLYIVLIHKRSFEHLVGMGTGFDMTTILKVGVAFEHAVGKFFYLRLF